MLWNEEQMRQRSHKLALQHDPFMKRTPVNRLWKKIEADMEQLRHFVKELHESRSDSAQPAEEWLMDHAEFLEAEMLNLKEEKSSASLKTLPYISKTDEPRVSAICADYLEAADGLLDEESFVNYVRFYQEVSILTIAEAWSIPLLMKIELIRRLTSVMELIRERRAIYALVDRALSGIRPSELSPERLKTALEEAGAELPLSGTMIVHLVQYLREHAESNANVGEWLICKLENDPKRLDSILSYEFQLQAAYQVTTGNVISSLRKLSRLRWSEWFTRISLVEQTLREERAGDYPRMDDASRDVHRRRVEKLARRMKVPENLVASQAVQLANGAYEEALNSGLTDPLPRRTNAAYYLLEADGLRDLQQALKQCGKTGALPEAGLKRRAANAYFQTLGIGFAAAMAAASVWMARDQVLGPAGWALMLLFLLVPMSEWAVTAVHWLIERVRRPVTILRYDFSTGVPEEASTMVVIPVIWSSVEDVKEMTDRLELHYLANRDPNIHFGILADFKDADAEELPQDKLVLKAAAAEIERLNRIYGSGGSTFHLLHRKRRWNDSEGCWMAWERKRGKLVEFVELLRGSGGRSSFSEMAGDSAVFGRIRYVITLDADTRLPLESARRMIGAMHLPYNRPRLNGSGTRVAEGYGVLQPRIGMSHESAQRSRLARLWSGDAGIDPYAFAVSDPYQDALGQGIFTGKGIFAVDVFHKVLCSRIPENRVLSHDLLEGGFLRAGLLSDIELIDDHPATFLAHQKRLHRWVRGDWQLLPWLRAKGPNRAGECVPIDLSVLTRWQMIDNLRRSLLGPVLMTVLLLAAPVLPGPAGRWYAVVFATMLLPVVRQLLSPNAVTVRPGSLLLTAGHVLLAIVTLPFHSAFTLDAIGRTLYRLFVSKRRLLEWVSQADVERSSGKKGTPKLAGVGGGYVWAAVVVAAALLSGEPAVQTAGVILAVLWAAAPGIVGWLDQPGAGERPAFSEEETEELRKLAHDIWSFYEEYVAERDNWLPPDNVQLEPANGVAHRTSPTNIGLYLCCVLSARDFGFIDTEAMVERLERTVDTIERMEKWHGHLYNWYNTETLEPLHPMYVSTVDSGNFVACLMTVREGVVEWIRTDGEEVGDDSKNGVRGRDDEFQVAFSNELMPGSGETKSAGHRPRADVKGRGTRLAERIDALVRQTDFRPLFDHQSNLFALGYQAERKERDTILYDLLASEARQASFVAIALGQVTVSHWNALGRTMARTAGNQPVLLSWSGTMFEYLMPWLLMRTYRDTLWDSTYRAVVERQMEYARQRNVPFGISESGFFAYDHQMNYQYRAFGVPGLGFKRGLEEDLVLAPYATIMALPYAKQEGLAALRRMESLGARGTYGFYEALDFTSGRIPEGKPYMIVRSFMAHHQGMSMLTLSNLLLKRTMVGRFHRNKSVRAAELLLQERMPRKAAVIKHPAMQRVHEPYGTKTEDRAAAREFTFAPTRVPETCVLSNGKFTTVVTNSGSGFSRYEGRNVTRWREEPVRDCWGSYVYIRDAAADMLWSATDQPCRTGLAEGQRVVFELDRAEFTRVDGGIRTTMEVCVSPDADAEVRRISLSNEGSDMRTLEVTTFMELSLSHPIADDAHPAFSKLFLRTSFDETSECLVAGRRPREETDKTLWAAHSLVAEGQTFGPAEYETNRAAFVGRGFGLTEPKAIRSRLGGKVGSVADPAFIMRRRVRLAPGQTVRLYAVTSVAETREGAVSIAARLANGQEAERTFQMAWNRTRIELRNLQLSEKEAAEFQRLAAQILYTSPLRKEREAGIYANVKGQPGLWSFGISGDRPIVLVAIDHRGYLPFVAKLLTGHEYLRRLGLLFDLVILNESAGGYYQDLQDTLQRAVEYGVDRFGAGHAGIHVLPASTLTEADRALLQAAARLSLRAGGPSLAAQLRLPQLPEAGEEGRHAPIAPEGAPAELQGAARTDTVQSPPATVPSVARPALALRTDEEQWRFFNGFGGFSPDGKEYRILIRHGNHLPAPWVNVLANPTFGSFVTELGTGYTWWRNSRECKLTPWSNDPVLDPPTEIGFLRDEAGGETWALTPSASGVHPTYVVSHGKGYSRFEHIRHEISHTMTVFVPREDPVKLIRVQLKNMGKDRRRLSLTYYAEWVLGVQRQTNAPYIVTDWDASASILTARNQYQTTFREAVGFLGVFAAAGSEADKDGEAAGLTWTGDQLEFVGRNGTLTQPEGMGRERLSCRTGAFYAPCGAVRQQLELGPGEERELYIVLGCGDSSEQAAALANKYREASECGKALSEVTDFWKWTLGQTVVSTPSPEMDMLMNGWLLYQSLACRMWARTAFYQAGGAYGFRDQLQDSLSLLHTMPEMTRRQIVIHAAHQYVEGDVQHWWHEETERGIRTLFSDDLLWLPYVASRYAEHTGDDSIWRETAPYLTSETLREGELERYEETRLAAESGTIYDHCVRAIEKTLGRIGEHGLPLIGVGDWNDGMNLVGAEGRGESVWLCWFLCEVLQRFEPVCMAQGEPDRAEAYAAARERLAKAANEHGWDGQWFRRAFTDGGAWLGSVHNGECRIDAIAQSWSVISGAAPRNRALEAMFSFDRELVDRDLSLARLLTPAFDRTDPSPGYIQGYPPGIRENGAQYTHGVIWSITAWSMLGQGDKAFELFHMLNPITHTRSEGEVRRYAGEPYVMAADVYTAEPHEGRAGWTWYTGAAGWMYQAGLESILGIRRRGDRLYLTPCIPSDWPGFTADYRYGKTVYRIAVTAAGTSGGVRDGGAAPGPRLTVDGQPGNDYVHLQDDGKEHRVVLTL